MKKVKEFFAKIKNLDKKKKLVVTVVACVVALAIVGGVIAAVVLGGNGGGSGSQSSGEKTTYSVSIETAGGMAMAEVDVAVYDSDNLKNMQDYGKTDENGKITFNIPENSEYAIVLSSVPKGYNVQESYKFDGTNANIVLTSSLVTDEDLSTAQLGLGDVMYDFTVTSTAGEEIKLSDVLKDKDLVVLNFWYTTCTWCIEEFPVMDEVYQDYKDSVSIIALNPLDDNATAKTFQEANGLSFPMATCPASWANTFGVTGYPTSVFIDRYGVICLIESGAITSQRPFINVFDHFTADNYKQMLCANGVSDLVTKIKPNVDMPSSEEIAAVINKGDINVTYLPSQGEDAEYSWPFVITEKLGEDCIMASNTGIDDSYAMIYAEVELKEGQALGFDYLVSSESGADILYVLVDDEDIFRISGVNAKEKWESCYPCVADADGTYKVVLCYLKDSDTAEGDDTVYIDNMRVVDASKIDVPTYIPRQAAVTKDDGDTYTYAKIVYNENDGYYHVGSANGALLLADLMNYTQFNEEESVYDIVYNGDADKDGVSLYDAKADGGKGMVKYFSYASNSAVSGYCTVNKELAEMLKQVAEIAGFDGGDDEWLKMCKYYQAYGTNGKQIEDPIKGLATFSAYTTKLGKNVSTNYFYYDRAILPRGFLSAFKPTKSGVYRFTSKSDYEDGIEAWIYDSNGELIFTYESDERTYTDPSNCSMVYYMEAGKTYYIDMAFWDMYEVGYIYYDVEYLGASYNLFRACSPGYFTSSTDDMYDTIAGGITPELKNGKYYVKGENSLIYADFTNSTSIFSTSIIEMIDMGGFDFSKSDMDGEILAYMKQNGNDANKTKEYLKTLWGDSYEENMSVYQVEDVLAGRYHGEGEDCTEEMRQYAKKLESGNGERGGCIVVDQRLAEILQMLMDKYTFEDVTNSWTKLCYYYDYLGK